MGTGPWAFWRLRWGPHWSQPGPQLCPGVATVWPITHGEVLAFHRTETISHDGRALGDSDGARPKQEGSGAMSEPTRM